jgi:hypothetical protein
VLLLGVLYHLRYPLVVLDRLAEMTRRLLFLQSHLVGPQVSHEPWADAEPEDVLADDFPRLSFVEGRYRGDVTNWWLPNYTALEALARSAGLRVLARPTPSYWLRSQPKSSRPCAAGAWSSPVSTSRSTSRSGTNFEQEPSDLKSERRPAAQPAKASLAMPP